MNVLRVAQPRRYIGGGSLLRLVFREGLIADATIQTRPRDPLSYGPTQQLGAWMRDQGIEAFEYLSTRC